MTSPDILKQLAELGLSVNQTKVYLSIFKHRSTGVHNISKETNLHRQDIYRILTDLEKKGLIVRKISHPLKVEAFPVEEALKILIASEKNRYAEQIRTLEDRAQQIVYALTEKYQQTEPEKEEPTFILLTKEEAIANLGKLAIEKCRKRYWVATTGDVFLHHTPLRSEVRPVLVKNKVEARVLIHSIKNKEFLERIIKKENMRMGNIAIKYTDKFILKSLAIFDTEVLIAMQTENKPFNVFALRTNEASLLKAFESIFESAWNGPETNIIYPKA
jgi:HTH-type transcriptional regulator, sugar sensing transcriptional regulator